MQVSRLLLVLALAAVLAAAGGCDDDEPGTRPALDNMWPHADGSTWTYEMDQARYSEPAAEDADGSEPPSFEALYAELEHPLSGEPDDTWTGHYTITLDGMITTRSGEVGQHMTETIEEAGTGRVQTLPPGDHSRRLLRNIARFRSDLADRLTAGSGEDSPAKSVFMAGGSLFMGGYAFAYEDTGYYGYGDAVTGHTWVYLEGHPKVGRTFSLPLLGGTVEDVVLQGRIMRIGGRRVGGKLYGNVVDCLYVIDFGEDPVVNDEGEVVGSVRSVTFGQVLYAPEIGPIACRERYRGIMRTAYNPEGTDEVVEFEVECRLVDVQLPD